MEIFTSTKLFIHLKKAILLIILLEIIIGNDYWLERHHNCITMYYSLF